jgi:hypothetical protein
MWLSVIWVVEVLLLCLPASAKLTRGVEISLDSPLVWFAGLRARLDESWWRPASSGVCDSGDLSSAAVVVGLPVLGWVPVRQRIPSCTCSSSS